jgi:beta-N-acetylhexosaminidase
VIPPGQLLFAGFEGTRPPPALRALIAAARVGGVVLFRRNFEDVEQARALVAELHACAPPELPLIVAIDEEGGRVQRLRDWWTAWPPMRRLGERDDPALTTAMAQALGRELADVRIDLSFAPVVDVDTNPANPVIGDRSFGRTPELVARHATAFIAGLQAAGVAACAKHFPGHGDTAIDSHVALPVLAHDLARLRAVELPPFAAAIRAGVASVMTAHVLLPAVDPDEPATLSARALGLLRHELGYDGLVFSDDLDMEAVARRHTPAELARRAIAAGVDVLLACRDPERQAGVLAALEAAPAATLAPALARLASFKQRYGGGRHGRDSSPPYEAHQRLAARIEHAARES